jgi:hypothetical protein
LRLWDGSALGGLHRRKPSQHQWKNHFHPFSPRHRITAGA